jgi:hypothetical protein
VDLNFPAKFLQKLELYQQIRWGQGISKHKHLWRYEAAFLQYAYEEGHQHLNSFIGKDQVIDWIRKIEPSYRGDQYEAIIGNLFWRGYIEVKSTYSADSGLPTAEVREGVELILRDKRALSNKTLSQHFEFRPTKGGLSVGEIISEVNNRSPLLRCWNRYKYNFVLDTLWLLVFLGLARLFVPQLFTRTLENAKLLLVTVFVIWPFVSFLYRKVFSSIENSYA